MIPSAYIRDVQHTDFENLKSLIGVGHSKKYTLNSPIGLAKASFLEGVIFNLNNSPMPARSVRTRLALGIVGLKKFFISYSSAILNSGFMVN